MDVAIYKYSKDAADIAWCRNLYKKEKKASTIIRLSMLLLSRGDWIRTSDHTPPRRVL